MILSSDSTSVIYRIVIVVDIYYNKSDRDNSQSIELSSQESMKIPSSYEYTSSPPIKIPNRINKTQNTYTSGFYNT